MLSLYKHVTKTQVSHYWYRPDSLDHVLQIWFNTAYLCLIENQNLQVTGFYMTV